MTVKKLIRSLYIFDRLCYSKRIIITGTYVGSNYKYVDQLFNLYIKCNFVYMYKQIQHTRNEGQKMDEITQYYNFTIPLDQVQKRVKE